MARIAARENVRRGNAAQDASVSGTVPQERSAKIIGAAASIASLDLTSRVRLIHRPLFIGELLGLSPGLALLVAGEPGNESADGTEEGGDST